MAISAKHRSFGIGVNLATQCQLRLEVEILFRDALKHSNCHLWWRRTFAEEAFETVVQIFASSTIES